MKAINHENQVKEPLDNYVLESYPHSCNTGC